MLQDISYEGIVYLFADKFGPVFALAERWVYVGMRVGELIRRGMRYMIRYVVLYFE